MNFFEWFYQPFFWFTKQIDLLGWAEASGDWQGYGFGLGFLFLAYNITLLGLVLLVALVVYGVLCDVKRYLKQEWAGHRRAREVDAEYARQRSQHPLTDRQRGAVQALNAAQRQRARDHQAEVIRHWDDPR
jgi:biopolymer transport protein ExbB/TolQ